MKRSGPVRRSAPSRLRSIASACASRPGPEQSSISRRAAPRRRVISSCPSHGSSARRSTAVPALRPAHDVHAVVHAVREVDVGAAAAPPHRLVARRAPSAPCVRGPVRRTEVRLDLDDQAGDAPPVDYADEALTEEPARGRDRICVEPEEAGGARRRRRRLRTRGSRGTASLPARAPSALDLAVARRRVGDEPAQQLSRRLGRPLDREIERRLVRLRRFVKPLSFRTNWSEAARISSSVTGGSKLKSVLMLRHIAGPPGSRRTKVPRAPVSAPRELWVSSIAFGLRRLARVLDLDQVAPRVGRAAVGVGEAVDLRELRPRRPTPGSSARSGSAASATTARPMNVGDSEMAKWPGSGSGSLVGRHLQPALFGDPVVLEHQLRAHPPRRQRDRGSAEALRARVPGSTPGGSAPLGQVVECTCGSSRRCIPRSRP